MNAAAAHIARIVAALRRPKGTEEPKQSDDALAQYVAFLGTDGL